MIHRTRPGARSRLNSSDDQSVALAAAAAQRRGADPKAASLELVRDSQHKPCAACSNRVPKRDRAAVDIHALIVKLEHAARVERHRSECFIDLHKVEVAHLEPG